MEVEVEGGGTFGLGLDALGRNGQPSCLEDSLVKATFWSWEEDVLLNLTWYEPMLSPEKRMHIQMFLSNLKLLIDTLVLHFMMQT